MLYSHAYIAHIQRHCLRRRVIVVSWVPTMYHTIAAMVGILMHHHALSFFNRFYFLYFVVIVISFYFSCHWDHHYNKLAKHLRHWLLYTCSILFQGMGPVSSSSIVTSITGSYRRCERRQRIAVWGSLSWHREVMWSASQLEVMWGPALSLQVDKMQCKMVKWGPILLRKHWRWPLHLEFPLCHIVSIRRVEWLLTEADQLPWARMECCPCRT